MRRLLRQRLRRKVIVTLKSGDAFSGVLFEVDPESIVLRDVEAPGAGTRGATVPVDGELLILRCDVAYMQLP